MNQQNEIGIPDVTSGEGNLNPWRKPFLFIAWGMILKTITLNFLQLQVILPTIGVLLLFFAFRRLQAQNRWFHTASLMAFILLIEHAVSLVVLATPLNGLNFPFLLGIVEIVFQMIQFLIFRKGVREVFVQQGAKPNRDPLLWATIWMVGFIVCALILDTLSWLIFLPLVIWFFVLAHSVYRVGCDLEELEFVAAPEKIKGKILVPSYLTLCFLLILVCAVCSNHLILHPVEFTPPSDFETRAVLLKLGFPKDILQDVSKEDTALLKDTISLEAKTEILEFSSPEWFRDRELEVTAVYMEQPNHDLYVLHYFEWLKGSAYWQDGCTIRVDEGEETLELIHGVLLYDRGETVYEAAFPRLKISDVTSYSWFTGAEQRRKILGAFNYPFGTKKQRGYIFYRMQTAQDQWRMATCFRCAHRPIPILLPYTEIEQRMLERAYDTRMQYTSYELHDPLHITTNEGQNE